MACMENVNIDKVFKEYGLNVEQLETNVYKLLNTDNETDVEGLQAELKDRKSVV